MTFAEFIFFCLFAAAIYKLFTPIQRRIEKWIYRKMTAGKRGSEKPVIDISSYKKKD
jgi:hypothetical protein